MPGYITKLEDETLKNENFRKVIFTGIYAQLVLMSLKPGEEIGVEIHSTTDQFIRIEAGQAKVIMNGIESILQDGDAVIVVAGTEHNVINVSATEDLKIYTLYSPAHHKEGTVHITKADANSDTDDHL